MTTDDYNGFFGVVSLTRELVKWGGEVVLKMGGMVLDIGGLLDVV